MLGMKVNEQITLKILEVHDTEALFNIVNRSRDSLREWLPWVDATKQPSDTRAFIKRGLLQFADGNGFQCGIWYEGTLAGVIGLHEINHMHRKTSLGYYLDKQYEGQGVMTQAVEALIKYCFEEVGLNRIEISAAVNNEKSQAIPERLGFTKEGMLRDNELLNGFYSSSYVYSLLKSEYNQR
ncbi:GNAT family N-acetyltransferase [Staphylococcus schweitzeri]|uniref:GNAT family N-acetyltransferase n=1 Tax=Staphylococcus schweitzeri TaxID=1654388 RepID=UPI0005079148|nr:GNAT family protein [Staphylococcus schweitzeri]CDR22493.1 Ribosomal-protein-L7p-serine acetyltransferase [Staphylococcus schweitzeri]CDR66653.1 Ribosomal-protein-L7p-serine acetyltransferase [Staphylococcus schweitzeri]